MRHEDGRALTIGLLLLCVAAVAGLAIQSCGNRREIEGLEKQNHDLMGRLDERAYTERKLVQERSQQRIRADELEAINKKLTAEVERLKAALDRAERDRNGARSERDRYLDELTSLSRRYEDALAELSRIAELKKRLGTLEEADSVRRGRIAEIAAKARELLRQTREARERLERQGE